MLAFEGKMTIYIYMLEWHKTASPAFHRIFVDCFAEGETGQIEEVVWDGKSVRSEWGKSDPKDVFVFCQKLPPRAIFMTKPWARVIWIPMWNNVMLTTPEWWADLPKNYAVISYSQHITRRAETAGLKVLEVKYVPDARDGTVASFENGNILFYWNRVGMVGPLALAQICRELNISKLLFKEKLDPGINPAKAYGVDQILLNIDIDIELVPFFDDPKDAERFIETANVVIAPRPSEGVGLAFLEAMARGCAVLCVEAPTMTDYIADGENGIYLNSLDVEEHKKFPMLAKVVSDQQDWEKIRAMDLRLLGKNARLGMIDLLPNWESDRKKIREFVMTYAPDHAAKSWLETRSQRLRSLLRRVRHRLFS